MLTQQLITAAIILTNIYITSNINFGIIQLLAWEIVWVVRNIHYSFTFSGRRNCSTAVASRFCRRVMRLA